MKTFLAVYTGSDSSPGRKRWDALTDEQRKQREGEGMAAWMKWGEDRGMDIVENGGPLGRTKRVDTNGVSDTRNALTGYTVIRAETHEAAAKQFENHPHFAIFPGEAVEIMEILPIPTR